MTQNYLLMICLIEIIVFYFIIYSLVKADRWVNDKIRQVEEISIDLPDYISNLRNELIKFNTNILKEFSHKPLSSQELGMLAGDIITDIIKDKLPIKPLKGKLVVITVLMKLWKYRNRLKVTFDQIHNLKRSIN